MCPHPGDFFPFFVKKNANDRGSAKGGGGACFFSYDPDLKLEGTTLVFKKKNKGVYVIKTL